MKNILLIIAVLFNSTLIFSQECNSYFPQEQGKTYEYQNLDKKNKLMGVTTKTVIKKTNTTGGLEVTIKEESKNKDADTPTTIEYTIKCKDGVMSVDMESYLDQEQMKAYEEMETEIIADNLEIPSNAKAGDNLGGGTVVAKISNQGVNVMTLNFHILSRKVDAIESITTDAGTFECIKITSVAEFKMMFSIKTTITEWYASGIGVIKTETYDKKGRILSSMVLSKIK